MGEVKSASFATLPARGANDYGGTLMEENISREAGATAGQYTARKTSSR